MNKILFVLLIILLGGTVKDNQKSLYLLYSKNNDKVKKFHLASDKYLTFTFEIEYQGKLYKTVALDETEPIQRDTVGIDEIPTLKPKDVKGLTKKYLEHYNYFKGKHPRIDKDGTLRAFNLNKMYDSIYIIIPDSCAGKAVITQVKYNPAFSID